MPPKATDPSTRLWNRVKVVGECWEFQGTRTTRGYGTIGSRLGGKRTMVYAHRVSYQATYGEFPSELSVLHRCDNPCCVRPDHLFLGTQKDNMQDAKSKGRMRSGTRIHNSRVNPEAVKVIRWMHAKGVPQKTLAGLYRLHRVSVHDIVHRINWASVA